MIWMLAGVILFAGSLWYCLKAVGTFRAELARLRSVGETGYSHPMLGVSLRAALPLPEEVRDRPAVVLIASPSCGACHDELNAFVKASKEAPIPFLCLYEVEDEPDEEQVERFLAQFGHLNLQPISPDTRAKLGIEGTPFLFMIDADGFVHRVQRPMRALLDYYRAYQRAAA